MPFEEEERRALGKAMMEFVRSVIENRAGPDDDVLRQVATEKFRRVVEASAANGIEGSLSWHTLAFWTEEGKERIGYYSRALECARREAAARQSPTDQQKWCDLHMQADSLFEIGRVHAYEGSPAIARSFFEEALPLARQADTYIPALRNKSQPLEGRILALMLQLPEEDPAK